jgi:hypothetical protein
MKKFLPLLVAFALMLAGDPLIAQVPAGLVRFGTTGAFPPQVGNCVSIMAMNSSGQTVTDSQVPCSPSVLATAYTNATVAYTPVLALPTVQGGTTVTGECSLVWESSSTSGTVTFAAQLSAAPTNLWVVAGSSNGTFVAPTYTSITTTGQTAITGALVTTGASTPYLVKLSFVLVNPTVANTLTIYAESNNTSYTATVLAGSSCKWVP